MRPNTILPVGFATGLALSAIPTFAPAQPAQRPTRTDRQSSPATTDTAAGLPAPVKPTKDDLIRARVLAADSKLRDQLEQEYPDAFGGTYMEYGSDRSDPISVYQTVGDPTQIKSAVESAYRAVTDNESLWPKLRFEHVTHSLRDLHALQQRLHDDSGALLDVGLVEDSTGIDDKTNSVVAFIAPQRPAGVQSQDVPAPDGPNQPQQYSTVDHATSVELLSNRYGKGAPIDVRTVGEPTLQDRFGDVPPWNGGDLIISTNATPAVCTTGYGMWKNINDVPTSLLVTAGHCVENDPNYTSYAWKNIPPTEASPPPSRTVGSIYYARYSGNANDGSDFALMKAPSSDLIWKGVSTRQYVLGVADPKIGSFVCREGAVTVWAGGGQQCSNIDSIDVVPPSVQFGFGTTAHRFYFPNAPGNPGDSGGPIVYPLSSGVVAVGIITSGYPDGNLDPQHHGVGEPISFVEANTGAHVRVYSSG